jgi:YidC/Oxa1 family membrane protein insertase
MWDTFIITPFINALLFIYMTVGQNFGVAIILFTILIRLITHPLTVQQIKGSTAMQSLQKDPRYQELQKKYKDNREKMAQEQSKLMKELGVNPLGACLPTLIQFPLIIGLYQTITRALATAPLDLVGLTEHIYPSLDQATALIPLNSQFLWMDLAQPERLVIPGLPFGIPVLAIFVVITTYLQSKLMTPPSANPGDQAASMSKAMNLYMPFLMGYLAFTLASGLALYFVTSNIVGIIQYAALGKIDLRSLLPARKVPTAESAKISKGKK